MRGSIPESDWQVTDVDLTDHLVRLDVRDRGLRRRYRTGSDPGVAHRQGAASNPNAVVAQSPHRERPRRKRSGARHRGARPARTATDVVRTGPADRRRIPVAARRRPLVRHRRPQPRRRDTGALRHPGGSADHLHRGTDRRPSRYRDRCPHRLPPDLGCHRTAHL